MGLRASWVCSALVEDQTQQLMLAHGDVQAHGEMQAWVHCKHPSSHAPSLSSVVIPWEMIPQELPRASFAWGHPRVLGGLNR